MTFDEIQGSHVYMDCNQDQDFTEEYRFGFNGQEKVNEISGAGNWNTALFWEYPTRITVRTNIDPVTNPSVSPYVVFDGNPVWKNDVLGDVPDPSTEVKENRNGTYTVTGGKSDGDKNIYILLMAKANAQVKL